MKKDNYDKIMSYLDVIEDELSKVAKSVGHCGFSEYRNAVQVGRERQIWDIIAVICDGQ
jgi:hypothetical protein